MKPQKQHDLSVAFPFPARAGLIQLAIVSSLLLATAGFGQSATAGTGATEPEKDKDKKEADQTVLLSPFVVDSSKDQGYRATSTLAGSRINTDLKDVAASITVVTKEFFNDVSAVGINDVLTYTANTEGTRDFTSSSQSLGRPSDDIAQNPNTANRIRGLAAADITRDYFYSIGTWAGFDTYNLDEVTIVRGPNSILAGLGSPAGIINYSPQLAKLSNNAAEVSYRFGSFGDQRATLSSNIVAVKNVLAFRVNGAWSDKGFEQKPAWNRDKRLYLAATWQPWKKTTVRAAFETVKVNSDNPNTITPGDGVSQWIALGKPTYDSSSAAPINPVFTNANNNSNTNGPNIFFNSSGSIQGVYLNQNTGYTYFQQNLSNVSIWSAPSMSSNAYIALNKLNLSPSLQNLKQRTFNFSIDQEIVPGLFANVAYVKENVDNNFLNLFRTEYSVYDVDVNARLPGGAANPHFMETYMQFRGLDNKATDANSNEVWRGTLNYDLNLTKINKWLGRYRLTGFAEDRRTETDHSQYNTRQVGGTDESIIYRYYLGGTPANNFVAQAVPLHPALYQGVSILPAGGSLNTFYGLKGDNKNLVRLKTAAAVIQAYFWDDKIVGTAGVRHDRDNGQFASGPSVGNFTVSPAGTYPQPGLAGYNPTIADTTRTVGVVVHPLKWLSFHYNRSENFIPNAGAIDLLGNVTPSPTGKTKEYGFSVNLLEDKLNAKVNWFETTAANAPAGAANFPIAQWTMPYMENEFMPNLAAQAGIPYTKYMSPAINQGSSYGNTVGDARLANGYTSSQVTKGIELELTYNVAKNWRVMASVSKQDAKQSGIATGLTAFIENRLAYWQSIPALWTGRTYNGSGWGQGRTGQQQWNSDNAFYYLTYKSAEGQPSTQLAKWHASALTNYSFSEGPLKGFSVGGGARYIEKSIIGNPAITDSTGTVVALDLAHPYTSPGYVSYDAWVGYRMRVFRDKYDLSFQLNGRDLQEGGGFRGITANSDGTKSAFRIVQPRTFYLTTTLGF